MKKILLGIVAFIVLAIVIFVVVIAMQPSEFRVTRSATIPASPEEVFPHVNDLHKWQAWSPWAERDPNAKNTFEGPEAGEGAKFNWDGNDQIGAGSMTITESRPPELVRYHLVFMRPYEDECDVEFQLQPQGEGTEVTWEMLGENNFMAKAMCLFMDMEGMVGKDFEEGLASLQQAVEEDEAEPTDDNVDADNDHEPADA